jgi:hypothetical protein
MNFLINIKTRFCLAVLLSWITLTPAAAKTMEDFQTWGNITAMGSLDRISPDFKYYKYWLEGQGRFGNDTTQFSQAIVRTGLGYALLENEIDTLTAWFGYAWVPTDEPFTATAIDEHRIWQQLLWSNRLPYGTITSRARLEQRFLESDGDVGWRYRQLLKMEAPLPWMPWFSFVAADEFFANINESRWGADNGFDQNRAFVGIGYDFDKHTKTEIGYMNQYIRKPIGPDRMDHIVSVNLYLNY